MKIEYGISNQIFGIDEVESKVASFGDGRTRISTVGWDGDLVGIQIVRDELMDKPFGVYKGDDADLVNNMPNHQKVYLVFDNVKSIDVAIDRLEEAKKLLDIGMTEEITND